MNVNCCCGGKLRRNDLEQVEYQGRTVLRDKDPIVASWVCDKCGVLRTQRKRRTIREIRANVPQRTPRELAFFYGPHDHAGEFRWWRNDNPGDMFDIISGEELDRRILGAAMCKIRSVSHLPGFCELGDACPDHLGYH